MPISKPPAPGMGIWCRDRPGAKEGPLPCPTPEGLAACLHQRKAAIERVGEIERLLAI